MCESDSQSGIDELRFNAAERNAFILTNTHGARHFQATYASLTPKRQGGALHNLMTVLWTLVRRDSQES